MLTAVEKENITGFVKYGIGTEKQEKALQRFGCVKVFTPDDLHDLLDLRGDVIKPEWLFREADTMVMVQPGLIDMKRLRQIDATGISWQVPGHDPVKFNSDEDRAAWRRQKPRGVNVEVTSNIGRPNKWPVPTKEQVASMVSLWRTGAKPSGLLPQVQEMMGAEVPMSWWRDQVIKATGTAKRKLD